MRTAQTLAWVHADGWRGSGMTLNDSGKGVAFSEAAGWSFDYGRRRLDGTAAARRTMMQVNGWRSWASKGERR